MNGDIAALIIMVLFTLLVVLKKTHVAVITMALCGGYVLSDRVSLTLSQQAGWILEDGDIPFYTIFKLLLLFGPPAFVAFYFRGTQRGSSRFVEQMTPAFALSLMLIVFILEQLPVGTRDYHLDNSVIMNQLWLYSGWVVLFAFATALFDLMIHQPKDHRRSKHKK
jgi:hypothetical protein